MINVFHIHIHKWTIHVDIQKYWYNFSIPIQKYWYNLLIFKNIDETNIRNIVLRPLLRNIAFNDLLKENNPLVVSIICYVNNTLVVTAEDDIPTLKRKVNIALKAMTIEWSQLGSTEQPWRWKRCRLRAILGSVPLLPLKVGQDTALYSPEILRVMTWWKADFQGLRG